MSWRWQLVGLSIGTDESLPGESDNRSRVSGPTFSQRWSEQGAAAFLPPCGCQPQIGLRMDLEFG